jgi:hypothetical protein
MPGGRAAEKSGMEPPGGMCAASSSRHQARPPTGPSGGTVSSGACGNTNRPGAGQASVPVNGNQSSADEP